MHADTALFTNITLAIVAAFIGGYAARRLKLPTMVGYLLAGMAIGPFTPGFVGDISDISQLAEMGVVLMMFGVGLHFSLNDLWRVRQIAIPGAILQITFATGLGLLLTLSWGWTLSAGLVMGMAISVASTVVLLRGLMDHGLLNTSHGQAAVGWLVFEDIATVIMLVLLPAFFGNVGGNIWLSAGLALLKTTIFVVLMMLIGIRVMPWLLTRIAHTRSRELFILAVVALALGTALGAAELFGVSLAIGAFLAGVVINESDVSHQVGAEVLPFREVFTVIFFVSVGMLVNPIALVNSAGQVIGLTLLVMLGKAAITFLLGLVLPAPLKTIVVVAAGLSQIGEFSFLVGQAALALGVLTQDQYGLILASALISIVLNPFLFDLIPKTEAFVRRIPVLGRIYSRHEAAPEPVNRDFFGHVVVVGYGRVGQHIIALLRQLDVPYLVVEQDAARAAEFQLQGVPTLFGDAANSEILTHVDLSEARALVVTIPDETATEAIVVAARDLAPDLPIIARAATVTGTRRLARNGAQAVINPALEGGLEVVRHTLLSLGYSMVQVQQYVDAVRNESYDDTSVLASDVRLLNQLVSSVRDMEIAWRPIPAHSPLIGQTIAQVNLRSRTGASIVALVRERKLLANPKSDTVFRAEDAVALIGEADQIAAAEAIIAVQTEPSPA